MNFPSIVPRRDPLLSTAAVARWLGVAARTVCTDQLGICSLWGNATLGLLSSTIHSLARCFWNRSAIAWIWVSRHEPVGARNLALWTGRNDTPVCAADLAWWTCCIWPVWAIQPHGAHCSTDSAVGVSGSTDRPAAPAAGTADSTTAPTEPATDATGASTATCPTTVAAGRSYCPAGSSIAAGAFATASRRARRL